MSFVVAGSVPWHEGEEKMQKLLRVPYEENPSAPYLTPGAAFLLHHSPLLALGTLDEQGRPWTTVWGGKPGFAGPVSESTIGIRQMVDTLHDPVVEALLGGRGYGEVVKQEGGRRLISGLPVDLERRKRVKLAGSLLAASLEQLEDVNPQEASSDSVAQAQLIVEITESIGNCPKYINKKQISPIIPTPKLVSSSSQLPREAIDLLSRIDTMFLSTTYRHVSMDTNIRGGPPGFVRVLSNEISGAVLVYPEYSGNRLYQSLGNMQTTPRAGYVFPDFESGNVLYVTGDTQILVGADAGRLLPRSNLAVKVTVTAARYVENGLPFRGRNGDPSPYNPAVRYLATEKAVPGAEASERPPVPATMIKKDVITPSISRFRFKILDPQAFGKWIPGQYATLSFRDELDMGYSHMRDDDPLSINDDYIRTFTVSSYPGRNLSDDEFEIIVRKRGNVTNHLFRSSDRSGLEAGLKGFDGEFYFEQKPGDESILPFIAGGIGITPAIAQLPDIDIDRFRLFWSISVRDIALVAEVFAEFPQLPYSTTLFITGPGDAEVSLGESDRKKLDLVFSSGAKVNRRRMEAGDLNLSIADVWYLCASPQLKVLVLNWLTGKRVIYEDFSY
ncbi:hypothetical protein VTO42DRAFT_8262 [Malbranchea cinnamomea]